MFKFWGDINSQSPKSQPWDNQLTKGTSELEILFDKKGTNWRGIHLTWVYQLTGRDQMTGGAHTNYNTFTLSHCHTVIFPYWEDHLTDRDQLSGGTSWPGDHTLFLTCTLFTFSQLARFLQFPTSSISHFCTFTLSNIRTISLLHFYFHFNTFSLSHFIFTLSFSYSHFHTFTLSLSHFHTLTFTFHFYIFTFTLSNSHFHTLTFTP